MTRRNGEACSKCWSNDWYSDGKTCRHCAREDARERYRENVDQSKATQHNSRAKKIGAMGTFTAGEFKKLCKKYKNACLSCGRDDVQLTPDHIVALSNGGTNDISNIQPLCMECNSSKGSRHSTDYR